MERKSVERRNRTRRKKNSSLPLITYTPNYKEVDIDHTVKIVQGWSNPYQGTGEPRKNIELTLKLSKFYEHHKEFHRLPDEITVLFGLDKDDDAEEVKKSFSIVFCAIIQKFPQGSHVGPGLMLELVMLDTCGNKYLIQPMLPPGRSAYYGMSTEAYTYAYVKFGPNSKILPDSMIDYLIENETKIITPVRQQNGWGIVHYILPIKTSSRVKSHRKFEPTADLAEYIEDLEMLPTLINEGVQMNAKNKNTNSKWNSLFKEMTSAKTKKNQDRLKNELTEFYKEKMKKYI